MFEVGCDVLPQVRMSWCVMQESIVGLKADMEVIFDRTGGRLTGGEKPEPFITMSQCQVYRHHQVLDKNNNSQGYKSFRATSSYGKFLVAT